MTEHANQLANSHGVSKVSMLSAGVRAWLDDPDGGGRFTSQAEAIREHDPECVSLADVWLPRKGGVTALGDVADCQLCEITFFWEGLRTVFEDCPESNHWLCACCAARATECPCGGEGR